MPLEPLIASQYPTPAADLGRRLATLTEGARAGQPQARAELRRACQTLEAHFVAWLLREMRATVPQGGLLPYGQTEETYDYLFDDALAKTVAQGGGIGLAKALEAQLSRRGPAPAPEPPEPGVPPSGPVPAETP